MSLLQKSPIKSLRDENLQKRNMILRSLLIVDTPPYKGRLEGPGLSQITVTWRIVLTKKMRGHLKKLHGNRELSTG